MSEYRNNIYLIILLLISFIQIFIFKYTEINKNDEDAPKQVVIEKSKSLNELMNDLGSDSGNVKIMSATKNNNIWNLRLKLNGNANTIKEQLIMLHRYDIIDYVIDKKSKEYSIIVELRRKN